MMAASASRPSVNAAGPGCRMSQDLISCSSPLATAGTSAHPGRAATLNSTSSGIACKQADGWVVADLERATRAPASAVGTYRMAASPFSPALLQAIDAMRDGDTLDAAAENAAKVKGWRR